MTYIANSRPAWDSISVNHRFAEFADRKGKMEWNLNTSSSHGMENREESKTLSVFCENNSHPQSEAAANSTCTTWGFVTDADAPVLLQTYRLRNCTGHSGLPFGSLEVGLMQHVCLNTIALAT